MPAEHCPHGVVFGRLGGVGRRNHGAAITAAVMEGLHAERAPLTFMADGASEGSGDKLMPFGEDNSYTLNNQFLILLGAGSSHGYGFPLWSQVSELLQVQFVEVEKNHSVFAHSIGISVALWKSNFALVKQCVQDVDDGVYNTIDEALIKHCQKRAHSMLFNKVFWRVMVQAFNTLIDMQGNTDTPLAMLFGRVQNNVSADPESMKNFHIHFLFKRYMKLALHLETAIIVDFNYDDWFKYCYNAIYSPLSKKLRVHHIKKMKEHIANLEAQLEAERKGQIYRQDNVVSFDNLLAKKKQDFGIDDKSSSMKQLEEEIMQSRANLHEIENYNFNLNWRYFQPHGTFRLNFGMGEHPRQQMWRYKSGEDMPENFPVSCYDSRDGRFTAINQEISASKPTILLIMGLSLAALRQNTLNINFGDIEKVYFTCYEKEQEGEFTDFLSAKFPNAELHKSRSCTELWEYLGKTAKIDN